MDSVAERQGMVCSVAVCLRWPVPTPYVDAKMEKKMEDVEDGCFGRVPLYFFSHTWKYLVFI